MSLFWLQQSHLVAKRRETGREMALEFYISVSLSYLKGSLTALKNPFSSAGFEPANLGKLNLS
jgi:hypothetical protein